MSHLPQGLYELVLTRGLATRLAHLPPGVQPTTEAVDPADAAHVIARYVHDSVLRSLQSIGGDDRMRRQVELANQVLDLLAQTPGVDADDSLKTEAPEQLVSIWPHALDRVEPPRRPAIPLSDSALLVNGPNDHSIGAEVCSELESADAVDLLCSFLKWTGLRIVRGALTRFLSRGGHMRVITTCYLGATDRRVLDDLVRLGREAAGEGRPGTVEVKVSYDTRRTRLHAKAWLFHRDTGFSTACIGSSNLSTNALIDGVEWNVRISGVDVPHILEKFRGTFEHYWQDPDFESYLPERDAERFDRAIAEERMGAEADEAMTLVDVHPYPYQTEILERLQAERDIHGRTHNLIVAATGTGKTMIAAFDYQRVRQQRGRQRDRLLFVAHRDHILKQALDRFRLVLRDNEFGELWDGTHKPQAFDHVFASIQTLQRQDLATLDPTHFDMVIVDEFHHAAAPTYKRLLEHVQPAVLLGLTATPERTDGLSVLHWFGDRIAAQLRLWHALERQLLAPFQYFGIADGVSLEGLEWKRGAYDAAQLSNVYTGNHARVVRILQAIEKHVLAPRNMKGIGFCVSVAHARFMAEQFSQRGLPSRAITGETPGPERDDAIRALKAGRLNVLFSVDVFSEGVDIPEVDTILLLRPTESATVFQQQLGRGLRLHPGKSCLTVLDFIGQAHKRFRFDLRFAALTPGSRAELRRRVEDGFPFLPSGCAIQLERLAKEHILENLKAAVMQGGRWLIDELRGMGDVSLLEFVRRADIDVRDVYGRGDRCWLGLRRKAGLAAPAVDERFLGAVRRMLHVDTLDRIHLYRDVLTTRPDPSRWDLRATRLWTMLHVVLFSGQRLTLDEGIERVWEKPGVREELLDVLELLEDEVEHLTLPLRIPRVEDLPFEVHGTYTLDEIMAGIGKLTADGGARIREGVYYHEESGHDLFFVTLKKSEKSFKPSTMYRDYAISPQRFHWESQNRTRADSATGRRYQTHGRTTGTHALFFVRATENGAYDTKSPYVFLGPADYVQHEGERPMAITWDLHYAIPGTLFEVARVAA